MEIIDNVSSLLGGKFKIQLRNKLTQRAIANECADWTESNNRILWN
jgi:hypothetical protein